MANNPCPNCGSTNTVAISVQSRTEAEIRRLAEQGQLIPMKLFCRNCEQTSDLGLQVPEGP